MIFANALLGEGDRNAFETVENVWNEKILKQWWMLIHVMVTWQKTQTVSSFNWAERLHSVKNVKQS